MRISVIGSMDVGTIGCQAGRGCGDISRMLEETGAVIAASGFSLVILPSPGVASVVATAYRAGSGELVIGPVIRDARLREAQGMTPFIGLLDERILVSDYEAAERRVVSEGSLCLVIGQAPIVDRQLGTFQDYRAKQLGRTHLIVYDQFYPTSKIQQAFPGLVATDFSAIRTPRKLESILDHYMAPWH